MFTLQLTAIVCCGIVAMVSFAFYDKSKKPAPLLIVGCCLIGCSVFSCLAAQSRFGAGAPSAASADEPDSSLSLTSASRLHGR